MTDLNGLATRPVAAHWPLIASLHVPVVLTDLLGEVLAWNDPAQRLCGQALVRGQPITELLPFVDPPLTAGAFEDLRGSLHLGGTRSEVEVSLVTLPSGRYDEREEHEAVFVIHHDSYETSIGRMREQLLYNVAHELRAPLSALDGVLEVLHSSWHELPAQEIGRLISSARRTSGRLRILTEDLLSAGSIQAGRFIVAPRDVSLRPIIDEAIEATIPHFEALEQAVELVMPDAEVGVHADPRYTSQVLVNLLLNASKYSPPQDRVVIVVQCEPERLRLTVEDHGKGIPPQQLDGLFQRFYRGGEQGFGLGLAIARNIIEAQGGEMGIESEVGQGTRVWLTLRKSELREDSAG